jgi:hypothetical protein
MNKFVNQSGSLNAISRVLTTAQALFYWQSLTVPITLNVVSVDFKNMSIPEDGTGLYVFTLVVIFYVWGSLNANLIFF